MEKRQVLGGSSETVAELQAQAGFRLPYYTAALFIQAPDSIGEEGSKQVFSYLLGRKARESRLIRRVKVADRSCEIQAYAQPVFRAPRQSEEALPLTGR
jgi:hypothetical protein